MQFVEIESIIKRSKDEDVLQKKNSCCISNRIKIMNNKMIADDNHEEDDFQNRSVRGIVVVRVNFFPDSFPLLPPSFESLIDE